MAELQVQALAAGIGGDQDLGLVGERPLGALALLQVHGAVEHHDRITTLLQDLRQHLLGGHELGEQQHLEGGIVFVSLELLDRVEQGLSFDVDTPGLTAAGSGEQQLHLGPFVLELLEAAVQKGFELLLALQLGPVLTHVFPKERELAGGQLQHLQAPLQGGAYGSSAGGDQPLHEDHQEANGGLLVAQGLVVALAHVLGDGVVEHPLL